MEQKQTPKPEANPAPAPPAGNPTARTAANPPLPTGTESADPSKAKKPVEIGGPSGPEPTRYGDWERNGRVSDF